MNDVDKINAINAAFQEAVRVGDGDKCASMYDEKGVVMPPNLPLVEGRGAIGQHFANLGPDSTVTASTPKIEVSGKLAYQLYRVSWGSDGNTKYTDCLDVLKQQDDGSWLAVASAWNSEDGFDLE